jgi:hypothetical protein
MPMIAFEIRLNDEKLCRAGIGDKGVLSAIVTWATRTVPSGATGESLFCNVGGLITPEGKHVSWINQKALAVGDRFQVTIVETDSVDEYRKKDPEDDVKLRQAKEDHVRRSAKELGWKVEECPKPAEKTH